MDSVHLTLTPFTHESRDLREIETLALSGVVGEATVLALRRDGTLVPEERDPRLRMTVLRLDVASLRWLPSFLRQPLQYASWAWKALRQIARRKGAMVHVHSLETLPVGVLAKWFLRRRLLYDCAELETGKFPGRPAGSPVRSWVERRFVKSADAVFVVSEGIADWYVREYGIERPTIVRNTPRRDAGITTRTGKLRAAAGLSDDKLLFLYQGAFIAGRGIELLIEAAKRLPSDRAVVFLGFGPLAKEIEEAALDYPTVRRVAAVPPSELLSYTADADLGLVVIEDNCLSYRYCLPNKLFEAYLCGVPTMVSDLVELGRFVRERRSGWAILPIAEAAEEVLKSVTREQLTTVRERILADPNPPCWEEDETRLLAVYRSLGKPTFQAAAQEIPST